VPKFTWNLDPALFHLGSYELRYYSLIFVAVFLGGHALLRWQMMRGGGDEEDASDFFVYGVLAVLIGARLGHVIFYDYQKALDDPIWIIKIWTGGLSSHGAVLGLLFAMWLFTKRRGIPFVEGMDRFTFAAALGATLVRIGNFFNSEIVGKVTDQSWGVRFPRYDQTIDAPYRHPTQIYETLLGLFVLLVLYLTDRIAGKEKRPRGLLVSVFFIFYFGGRFFIEFFKELQVESIEKAAGFTMGQMLSMPCILAGLIGLVVSLKKRVPVGWYPEDEDEDEEDDDEDEEDDDERDEDEGDDDDQQDDEAKNDDKKASKPKASKSKSVKPKASSEPAVSPKHDADVDEEFSLSEEERKRRTREELKKDS
jgi:phosphatidylglycerol---prolipoprotein diacylglyceryl transferase